jgi:hypothetical protein
MSSLHLAHQTGHVEIARHWRCSAAKARGKLLNHQHRLGLHAHLRGAMPVVRGHGGGVRERDIGNQGESDRDERRAGVELHVLTFLFERR